jgi:8-oxo-(d)GTP phosphatase
MADLIEAAGVVLVRPGADGDGPEVAVVHRPHRSDWSLPKGKLEQGERHETAAVRETFEETGVVAVLGPSLGHRRYTVDGAAKRVRYWRATVHEAHDRVPDGEVDEIRWLRRKAAKALLTYSDDRDLVDVALGMPDTEATIVLRHAEATKRAAWRDSGDDRAAIDAQRPLNDAGAEQSHRLVALLDAYRPATMVSSDAARCRATVEPYAAHSGLSLHLEHALSEEGCASDPRTTVAAVERLLESRSSAVWCTHRPVLPIVLGAVADALDIDRRRGHMADALDPRLRPGTAIVLHRAPDGVVVSIDRLED